MSVRPIDKDSVYAALKDACDESAWSWFSQQQETLTTHVSSDQLAITLAMARRQVGDESLGCSTEFQHWRRCDAARVLLLEEAKTKTELNAIELLKRMYQIGDEFEKEAILKGISLLDPQGELKELVVDACRTNIVPMLAAVAMHNHYPVTYFSGLQFNQMVLKCLFLDLDISHVQGLTKRAGPDLSRMCFDLLRERLAANREPPNSIWLAIRPNDIDKAIEYLEICLQQENASLNHYMAQSLKMYCSNNEIFATFLKKIK